ncbi:MAG: acetylornithine/succinylornithine family transaminase [Acidimicrobiaceae bacterium]|uniref:acetylornithine/succinylornithine family transaminase n=1 Tax=Candidatus Poriferisodalis multihospitum TaxID=2983191 RepID=UPI0022A1EEF9|nr:acetylornithine/succinylornithine family transaminase [Candidatus Poriferisodalis multihospitum]MCY3584565.1 acetylornithine/succinylornithine family transaminase [Acidimicrobiaceae bacterium]MCY3607271.1 acetylornithine/succinylornithine family transaminase [Acidimicrobiaceae bacterium]MCY3894028.1 acetylornithine/succinylornithine family transaminase [Acidimicrobiaceae bacterium]MCY3949671.1 acetylornithine/succinylornithine family transaminase [Acidimicrobiaceae bacterium]MDE0676045.1 ac
MTQTTTATGATNGLSPHAAAMGAAELGHCPLMPTYGPPPVQFVRGSGCELYDRDGKRYLDFLAGLAVTSLGHSHPAVADALNEQARTLLHVSNLFGTEPQVEVAQTIDRLQGGGGQVFFCNSGAESLEGAIKLARKHGGRGCYVVVSALRSFHGRTLATLHATGQPEKHETFQPLPEGFRHVPYNDAEALEAALDPSCCAVLLEVVQGEGGVNVADSAYLHRVREICDERGMVFIVDEVQTGLARTGEWFAWHHHFDPAGGPTGAVRPDIVTMAKALGNGVPIGAVWARREVAAAFQPGDHATTFGGQPLAASAARAVLRTMEAIGAPAVAAARGEELAGKLMGVPGVVDTRGLGLLIAAELDTDAAGRSGPEVAAACLEAGLVINGITPTAVRFAPPLVVSSEQIDEGLAIFASVLASNGKLG